MKMMTKSALILLAVVWLAAPAGARESTDESYEFLAAKLAAAEGRFDEALLRLDRLINSNPADPILIFERAMLLIDAGRMDRAESELRKVLEKNPDFYDANRVMGRLLLDRAGNDRRRISDALRYLQAAFKTNPDDLSTGHAVSQILMSLGRVAEAERILAVMVERAPDQRMLNYSYAQVLTRLGRGDESKPYLERSLVMDPTFAPAVMQLLEIYQQENEWRKAADVLQPLIADDPMNVELLRQQGYFLLRAGSAAEARDRFRILTQGSPNDVRSLFYLAESLNELEEYAEAEPLFRRLLEVEPDDADVLASLGLSQSGQKKWDAATETFNRILHVPGVPENVTTLARTQLAYIDLQKGNYEAAIETAKPVFIFRDRPNAQAINIALEALKKQEKPGERAELLEPLVSRFDADPFINSRYIEALARAGRNEEAARHAELQRKKGSRNVMAAAEAWLQAENAPAAVALVEAAVADRPDDIDLRFQLGSLHERAGDHDAAEKVFLGVLESEPDHAPSLNYLGYMWAEAGKNLERAREMLIRAVGQEPNNGAYVDSLGWVYYQLGQLEEAKKYLSYAARLLPRDPTIQEHLGDVLARQGNTERALEIYRIALELDPEAKDAEKLRLKIAEIEAKGQSSRR
jgi:tetratricopeptide (TPR) repeat protein